MIWFNLNALESKIADDNLTDKDGLIYFLTIFGFTAIIFCTLKFKAPFHIDTLISILILLIISWGIISSYSVNKKIDNKDFFNRFFALSLLVGIRIILFIMISLIFIDLIRGLIPHYYLCKYNILFLILFLIYIMMIWIVNYLMILNSFNRIRKIKNYLQHAI
jgi:hypothetical protein